jgi:hypothetical protein
VTEPEREFSMVVREVSLCGQNNLIPSKNIFASEELFSLSCNIATKTAIIA